MRAFRFLIPFLLIVFGFSAAFAANKGFYREDIAIDAARFETKLKSEGFDTNRPAKAWRQAGDRARARGDLRTALSNYKIVAVIEPNDWLAWMELSRTYLAIESDDWQERWQLPQYATSAAYLAYMRASDPKSEAEALAQLGATLARREIWRPAIDAYKASLDTYEIGWIAATYQDLRDQHGFRLLDYSVDSDAASPRACLQFSENLSKATADFAPFIAVSGIEAPVVTAENASLCVDGLKHGDRYEIMVREGVPSEVGEVLQAPSQIVVYVRDRTPQVRFTGRNYVLPRTGQRGIPIVTVNTPVVDVEIYRIGDRSIVNAVLEGEFQSQLDGSAVENLITDRAHKVWTGKMPVEGALNADVTTAFPIDEAVGDLQPGVYVMFAKAEGAGDDYWEARPTQWFVVSDLGLASISADDGLHAFMRSLSNAEPLTGVTARLISKSNEVLAERQSDVQGYIRFEAGLVRGEGAAAPALLVAEAANGDYAFLDLSNPGFDLTDRGVAGRPAPGPIDAFLFTERGVYRSGETVHLTALARDAEGRAVKSLPLTITVDRPDGVEQSRYVLEDDGIGGRNLDFDLLDTAMHGTWRIEAFADPKGSAIGSTTFLIDDYVPDRLEITLDSASETAPRTEPVAIDLAGRYLYGAPAGGLKLDGEVVVKVDEEFPAAYPGTYFGITEEEVTPVRRALEELPLTDEAGKAAASVALPPLPATEQPLVAAITLRLGEPGGRAVEKTISLPVAAASSAIGIKPDFEDLQIGEGELAGFSVITVDAEGNRAAATGLQWTLSKLETRYQWYNRWGSWEHETLTFTKRIANGTLDVGAADAGRLSQPVEWGRYRLEVASPDPSGPVTSITFDAGWYGGASADSPDMLEVSLDKESYRVGEIARLNLSPRFAGKALIAVVGETTHELKMIDVPAEGTTVELEVGADWAPGAYATAMLYRPLDIDAGRMPGRAVGLAWVGVDTADRELSVTMATPDVARPEEPIAVPLTVEGLAPGEAAHVVVAAVDVGILNLTAYQPPAPEDWFFAQRALSAELRDLYGSLIDGMQGVRGRIRTGGDGMDQAKLQGSPPSQAPVALYSGIVAVDETGAAKVEFTIPPFAGTVRLMAVAWSADKVGHGSTDVIVRDPVVVIASLPRFLAVGDQSQIRIDLDNRDGPAGDYGLAFEVEGPVQLADGSATPTVALPGLRRQAVTLPVTANAVGRAEIRAHLTGPDGLLIARSFAFDVEPATAITSRRMVQAIGAGGSLSVSADLLTELVPGTGKVSVAVGPGASLDLPGILAELDRYPYGCAEQITSKAMPLLYVAELAAAAGLSEDDPRERVATAVTKVLANQGSNGSFGLWGPGGEDLWLDAYVSDFLTRARERGYEVPDRAFAMALDRLRNVIAFTGEVDSGSSHGLAYALYVLSRNGRAPIGDLRYFADTKLDDFDTVLSRAQIGAALAMTGDKPRAERAFAAALGLFEEDEFVGRADYGSNLRDGAAALTLAVESGSVPTAVPALASEIGKARESRSYTSTQENAWLVLAANALMSKAEQTELTVNGASQTGAFVASYDAEDLGAGAVTIGNAGKEPVEAVVTVRGAPTAPEEAAANGLAIERRAYLMDGEEVALDTVGQNTRLLITLRVEDAEGLGGRLLVVDRLPAGFEIDSPRLVGSADLARVPWLTEEVEATHTEFRDDRFVASFDRSGGQAFTVAYVARAVTPGTYVQPAATVEDMYRPERFGRTDPGAVTVEAAK